MRRIWGHRGEYYGVDYTVDNDPTMRYMKVRIKGDVIEAEVIAAVAESLGIGATLVKPSHIVRMDS